MKLTCVFPSFLATCLLVLLSVQAQAITIPQIDDFQNGLTGSWTGSGTANIPDVGPTGVGDHSLEVTSFQRFITYNNDQWAGDWSTEAIKQVSMDVRHANAFDLVLWLGISKGTPEPGAKGDNYVTDLSINVPGDENWHTLVFDVTAADFSVSPTNDAALPSVTDALAAVFQFRIIHNTTRSFKGELVTGSMLLDNIQAVTVPEPTTMSLVGLSLMASLISFSRNLRT